jgi:hypothetical protein
MTWRAGETGIIERARLRLREDAPTEHPRIVNRE